MREEAKANTEPRKEEEEGLGGRRESKTRKMERRERIRRGLERISEGEGTRTRQGKRVGEKREERGRTKKRGGKRKPRGGEKYAEGKCDSENE